MEIIDTYNGSYSDNKIIINETVDNPLEKFYVYRSRNDRIYTFHKGEKEYLDDFTIIYVDNESVKDIFTLNGNVKIDVIVGEATLLEVLFGIQKKYVYQ